MLFSPMEELFHTNLLKFVKAYPNLVLKSKAFNDIHGTEQKRRRSLFTQSLEVDHWKEMIIFFCVVRWSGVSDQLTCTLQISLSSPVKDRSSTPELDNLQEITFLRSNSKKIGSIGRNESENLSSSQQSILIHGE